MEKTEWRVIADFPSYEVSDKGRVRRCLPAPGTRVGKILRPELNTNGYPQVQLRRDNQSYMRRVHQLVARAFLGPPPTPKHGVAHNDGRPTNCRKENLRWATQAENLADRIRHGTINRGERHGLAILTRKKVLKARQLRATGMIYRDIAKIVRAPMKAVHAAVTGIRWGWLDG